MSRVLLRSQYKGFQPDTTIEVDAEVAESLIKNGVASKGEAVYNHEDEMTPEVRAQAHKALAVAEAAGPASAFALRSAALESFRKK